MRLVEGREKRSHNTTSLQRDERGILPQHFHRDLLYERGVRSVEEPEHNNSARLPAELLHRLLERAVNDTSPPFAPRVGLGGIGPPKTQGPEPESPLSNRLRALRVVPELA